MGVLAAWALGGRVLVLSGSYLSVPLSILVSRLNYGVWAFSSPEQTYIDTYAQIDNRLGDPLIPIKVIGESERYFYISHT